VPSVVLKMALDEMALDNRENQFYDSDDEDDDAPKKAKKKSDDSSDDQYDGSLSFKAGRNANSSLYYVDHTKQKNNGNGLEPDQRNELINNLARAQEEESVLKAQLQSMTKETAQLLSEPTNEEATATLERQEAEMNDIRDQLESARQLKVNEKHKKTAKRRIENLTQQWRKRKRLCMDFLIQMEDSTEGTITAKKCLSGDGQIDIESDESAIKNAIAYGRKKRTMASRPMPKKKKVSKGLSGKTTGLDTESLTSGLTPDPNFVAVRLNSAGQAERVYIGDDE
jgi:small-conductance mechanosensitive channel